MANPVITPEIDAEIRKLAGEGLCVKRISNELKIIPATLHSHMKKNDIPRNKERRGKAGRHLKKNHVVPAGYFNEHERENWLM